MENRIKELRQKQKISQAELAEKAGISRATLVHLENGDTDENAVKMGTVKNISAALGASLNEVFGINEDTVIREKLAKSMIRTLGVDAEKFYPKNQAH